MASIIPTARSPAASARGITATSKGPYTQTWHRNEKLLEEPGHVTDLIAAEAVQWIEARGEAPFFLYVPFTAVHLPIKEPDEWLRRVPDAIHGDVPRHYAACVMHLDDAVGRILAALEKNGKRDNTLVVFTSDNGGSTVENNDLKYPDDNCPNGKLTGNNTPWRGQKGDLYEGGTRVPTVVSWPGRVEAGKVAAPVQITDWMPTFCSLGRLSAAARSEMGRRGYRRGADRPKRAARAAPVRGRPGVASRARCVLGTGSSSSTATARRARSSCSTWRRIPPKRRIRPQPKPSGRGGCCVCWTSSPLAIETALAQD